MSDLEGWSRIVDEDDDQEDKGKQSKPAKVTNVQTA
jgi:hypothetical protein